MILQKRWLPTCVFGCWVLIVSLSAHANIAVNIEHASVAGMQVYSYQSDIEEVVVLQGWLPAGDVFSPANNPAVATLTAGMLDKGTSASDKFALAKQLEDVGASISFGAGSQVAVFSARCLKKDLPLVVALLAEQLRTPAFAADELRKYKAQLSGALRGRLESTDDRASEAFYRTVYPEGHPNRPASVAELTAGIEAASTADLKAFHAAHYGPAHLTIVAVGDVDATQLRAELARHFAGWRGGASMPPAPALATTARYPIQEKITQVPGKTSVNILWGQPTGLRDRDVDALALRAGIAVLGSGFTGRLMSSVRDKEGLTYRIGAAVGNGVFVDGDFSIGASFAPSLLDKGIESTRQQLMAWWQQGVTAAELQDRKANLVGSYRVSLATTNGIAGAIANVLQSGRGLQWLDEYPQAVNALTLDRVNGAIRKYIDPQRMLLVKAGSLQ